MATVTAVAPHFGCSDDDGALAPSPAGRHLLDPSRRGPFVGHTLRQPRAPTHLRSREQLGPLPSQRPLILFILFHFLKCCSCSANGWQPLVFKHCPDLAPPVCTGLEQSLAHSRHSALCPGFRDD